MINSRAWIYEHDWKDSYLYFTTYDLWDVAQNDSTPCIWASWKNLCDVSKTWIQTIALTVDQRQLYDINFWDTITLEYKFSWDQYEVQVEDEMNKRFRNTCIRKDGYCIKWDIARYNWESDFKSWIYRIIK